MHTMRSRTALLAIIGALFCSCLQSEGQSSLTSFEETLKSHHIALTKAGLEDALKNPVPEVRSTAALQLASRKATDSRSSIAAALESEKNMSVYLNMALALATLGDERGKDALRKTCDDQNQQEDLRLSAARDLIDVADDSCFNTVRNLLSSDNALHRFNALQLAKSFHHLSEMDNQSLSDSVAPSLSDSDPDIRIAASAALAALGQPASIALIETAASVERDPNIRDRMNIELRRLRKRAPKP